MSDQERGMGASEERRFHESQDAVNLQVEGRLTRLEVLLYITLALSAVNVLGLKVLDTIYLWRP